MPTVSVEPRPSPTVGRRFRHWWRMSRVALWVGFVLVHGLVILLALGGHRFGLPLGDVSLVYKQWAVDAAAGDPVVGIDLPWVYPILAFVPMMVSLVFGPALYDTMWLILVAGVNAFVFFVMTSSPLPRARVAAWWWLGFLALLGPIGVARIDALATAPVLLGFMWLARHPAWGVVLLTIAAWVKVWPAAVIAAVVVTMRHRMRLVGAALATSAVIATCPLILGSGMNVLSFITQQTGRGLQIEAPISTPWLWLAAAGDPEAYVYYDREILTFQVSGPGVDVAASVMTPLMALVAFGVLMLAVRATRSGADFVRVLPPTVLALTTALIAFNKVGSPQFIGWLAAPVILGILFTGRHFTTPAIIVALLAALTQVIYPYWYVWLLSVDPAMVAVVTVRNLLEFALLAWALAAMWRAGSDRAGRAAEKAETKPDQTRIPVFWPSAPTSLTVKE